MNTKNVTIDEIITSLQQFGWLDYSVFILMLIVCTIIGIYFGFIENKDKNSNRKCDDAKPDSEALEYLVGGRKMQVIPIAVSLVSSWISGITLLGTGTETYLYGTQYLFIIFAVLTCGFIKAYVFLPVFHDLKLTSTYEYFEHRFDKRIRFLGSIMNTFGALIWMPIAIYVPALAFNQVSGINIYIVTPIVCVICIFYTCVGGIKAVVWTDVFQCVIMYGIIILIVVKGLLRVGGISEVWERNWNSGRIEAPEFTFDLTERHTVFSLFIGGLVFWVTTSGASQGMVQRYLTLGSMKDVRKAVFIFTISVVILLSICGFTGLLMYATYYKCDPLTTKLAKAKDQLMPLYVMDILQDLPGIPGFFVAGVFSAALSSLSTTLNSLSAVVLEDYVKPYMNRPLTETETRYLMRGTVCVCGTISTALVLVIEKLGTVLQLSMSLGAMMSGPLFGLFLIGLLLPWINGKAALIGTTGALCSMTWIVLNAQAEIANGMLQTVTKPTSVDDCEYYFEPDPIIVVNQTITTTNGTNKGFSIYHLSYLWFSVLGSSLTIIVSAIATLIVGAQNPSDVDLTLLAPFLRKYIKPRESLSIRPDIKEMQCVIHAFETKDNQIITNKL